MGVYKHNVSANISEQWEMYKHNLNAKYLTAVGSI